MSLEAKFYDLTIDEIDSYETREILAKQCVQICDEYILDFDSWKYYNGWAQVYLNNYKNLISGEMKTPTKLLEIYKQGL